MIVGIDVGATSTRAIYWGDAVDFDLFPTGTPDSTELGARLTARRTANGGDGGWLYAALAPQTAPDLCVTDWPSRPDWIGHRLIDPGTLAQLRLAGSCDDGAAAAWYERARHAPGAAATVCAIGTGLGLACIDADGGIATGRGGQSPAHLPYPGGTRRCRCGASGCLQTALATDALRAAPPDDAGTRAALATLIAAGPPGAMLIVTGGGSQDPTVRARLSAACDRLGQPLRFAEHPMWSAAAGAVMRAADRSGVPIAAEDIAAALATRDPAPQRPFQQS